VPVRRTARRPTVTKSPGKGYMKAGQQISREMAGLSRII